MNRPRDGRPGEARRVINDHTTDPLLRFEFDRGSNYEDDTRVTDVLAAVVTDDELHHEDHRFFQINHLQTELAWAQMHDAMVRSAVALEEARWADALHALERSITVSEVPLQCARALQDSLPQLSLLAMRSVFPPNTTGLDSPGMRNLRRAARAVWHLLIRSAERLGTTPEELVRLRGGRRPENRDQLLLGDVLRAAYRLDSRVLEWKRSHIQLVWMMVGGNPLVDSQADGSEPTSLRGTPVTDLERMAARPMFPELWQLTAQTFAALATGNGRYARSDDPPAGAPRARSTARKRTP